MIDIGDPWPALLAGGDGDRGEAKVSPDGTRVASTLLHRDDLNCTSLHVTDLSTGNDVVVAGTPGRNVRSPAWSPDGRLLAYADESPGWYEVFVVAADGSEPGRQLTSDGADFAELRWSPDGSHDPGRAHPPRGRRPRRHRRGDAAPSTCSPPGGTLVVAGLAARRVGRRGARVAHDATPAVPDRRR